MKKDLKFFRLAKFLGLLVCSFQALAIDTSAEEAACLDIGFKKKTQAFANCVLELYDRRGASNPSDPDDATCRKYGFKPKTNEYATCRLQIDQARQDSLRLQAQEAEQQRRYQEQLAEQKSRAAGLALMQMGLGVTSGAYNANNGYGSLPNPPAAPSGPRIYSLPNGKTMSCTTTGNITNCF